MDELNKPSEKIGKTVGHAVEVFVAWVTQMVLQGCGKLKESQVTTLFLCTTLMFGFLTAVDVMGTEMVHVFGKIERVSDLPDSKRNDYDNCLYCVEMQVWKSSGSFPVSGKIILVLPILKQRLIQKKNILVSGDVIEAEISKYEEMPESIKQIQISNNFDDWTVTYYFVQNFKRKTDLQKKQPNQVAPPRIIKLPPALRCSDMDHQARQARKQRIENELRLLDKKILQHGGSFKSWKKEFLPIAVRIQRMSQEGKSGWIDGAYFASPGRFPAPDKFTSFIAGIQPYQKYLAEHNIDLILVKIPTKGELSSAVFLSTDTFYEDPAWLEFYHACLTNDIEVVDPLHEMLRRHAEFPLTYFYHVPQETHPCVGASWIIGEVLGKLLKRYGDISNSQFVLKESQYTYSVANNLTFLPDKDTQDTKKEYIRFPVVLDKITGKPFAISPDIVSPFLFLSNSFGVYPDAAMGGSIPHYTAYQLGVIPAWSYQNGVDISMLRNCIIKSLILDGRKAVIFIIQPTMWAQAMPQFPPVIQKKYSRLIELNTLSAKQLSGHIKMRGPLPQNKMILQSDGLSLDLRQEKNLAQLQIKIPISAEAKHYDCVLRLNYRSHGWIRYKLEGKINAKVYRDHMDSTISDKDVCDELLLPKNIENVQLDIGTSRGIWNLKNIEIFRCE